MNGLAVDPNDPAAVYTSIYRENRAELFRSSDSGTTWQKIDVEDPVFSLAIAPTSPPTILVGALDLESNDGLVYRSAGDGSTFDPPIRVGYDEIRGFAVDPRMPGAIFAVVDLGQMAFSNDSGRTWTATTVDFWPEAPIVVDRNGFVYVSSNPGIYRSTDGGSTWVEVNATLRLTAISSDGGTPGVLYVGTEEGFYRSVDQGLTWTPLGSGLPPDGVLSIAVDPEDPTTLYAGTGHGLFRSLDGGSEWTPTALTTHRVTHLAISAADPATIYAGLGNLGVARVEDRGAAWQRLTRGLPRPSVEVFIDPFDPTVLYTIGDGFFRSGDSGHTWELLVDGLGDPRVQSLAFHPSAPDSLYVGTCRGVFRTSDAGRHWEAAGFPTLDPNIDCITSLVIDRDNPDTIYAAAYGVFKTTDGGKTWNRAEQGIETTYPETVVSSPHDSTLYAATPYPSGHNGLCSLYKTSDGGRNWTPTCAPRVGYREVVVDPGDPERLLASFSFSDDLDDGIYESRDGGSTWSVRPLLTAGRYYTITALAPDSVRPGKFMAASSEVFRSSDGGRSWQVLTGFDQNRYVSSFAFHPGPRTIVYAGTDDGVYEIETFDSCPGDCNRDGVVSIVELLLGVGASIEGDDADACPNLDQDNSGSIEVSELVSAVNEALSGCGPS